MFEACTERILEFRGQGSGKHMKSYEQSPVSGTFDFVETVSNGTAFKTTRTILKTLELLFFGEGLPRGI
jgi:hypothetical protein